MTRISSAIKILKRVGFAVLLLGGNLYAQPQAPIEWETPRWANIAGWPGLPQIVTLRVIPLGDTLLFTARNAGSAVSDTILVCSSFDNGQTFTPWIPLSDGSQSVSASFTASDGYIYGFFFKSGLPPDESWIRVSADGGLSWSPPRRHLFNTLSAHGYALGNDVLIRYRHFEANELSTQASLSSDHGVSWSTLETVDTADFNIAYAQQTIAFTRTKRILIEEPMSSRFDPRLYVAIGDSSGENWTPFEVMPCQYYNEWACQNRAAIIADTAGEQAGVIAAYGDEGFNPLWPLYHHSNDVGLGWDSCIAMTEDQYVIPWPFSTYVPLNIGAGKLWLVGWEHVSPAWGNWVMTRFSANHGRNWYPLQAIADSSFNLGELNGQIRGNRIDVYWDQGTYAPQPYDYRMVSGTITPDTVYPEIEAVLVPPDTVDVGSGQLFTIHASDNDTLSEVRLFIEDTEGHAWRRLLRHVGDNVYDTTWTVPDTGYYGYWFEAEDWWEQVTRLPDSGNFHFVTDGWSRVGDRAPLASEFGLSVYPNPSNSAPVLSLSPEWVRGGQVELAVYNVLGQKVWQRELSSIAGAIPLLDADAATGVYLLRVSTARHSVNTKFIILK